MSDFKSVPLPDTQLRYVPLSQTGDVARLPTTVKILLEGVLRAATNGKAAADAIDRAWLENDFIPAVQQRGAAVIAARGASSAFSAAQALIDHVRSLVFPTPSGDCFSAAVVSDGSYGVPEGLVSSFPLHSKGDGGYELVRGVKLDRFATEKIAATVAELVKERDLVKDLLT